METGLSLPTHTHTHTHTPVKFGAMREKRIEEEKEGWRGGGVFVGSSRGESASVTLTRIKRL